MTEYRIIHAIRGASLAWLDEPWGNEPSKKGSESRFTLHTSARCLRLGEKREFGSKMMEWFTFLTGSFASWYEKNVLPALINKVCSGKVFKRKRLQVVPKATGKVLEIGFGSGTNLHTYDFTKVESIKGVDPSEELLAMAKDKIKELEAPIAIDLVVGSAEELPFGDEEFDSVVVAFTLCSIPNVEAALQECSRVLKVGGLLLFAEHGLSPDPDIQKWQHRITPYWSVCAGNCHLNRNIEELILSTGSFAFKGDKAFLEKKYSKGPKFLSFFYYGIAYKTKNL